MPMLHSSTPQRRVSHDLVINDDHQETKWRWMAKQDQAKLAPLPLPLLPLPPLIFGLSYLAFRSHRRLIKLPQGMTAGAANESFPKRKAIFLFVRCTGEEYPEGQRAHFGSSLASQRIVSRRWPAPALVLKMNGLERRPKNPL